MINATREIILRRQRETPIAGPGGNYDTTTEKDIPVIKLDRISALSAFQCGGTAWNSDARTEFKRLNLRAEGKVTTRNAGWKADIVLDP